MHKKQFNLIGEAELQKVNREIIPLFGVQSGATSGSIYIDKGKKVQCHIAVGNTSTYNSLAKVKKIGKKVKEVLGVHEVYSFGIKLA